MTYTPTHCKRWTLPDSYMGAQWPDYYVFLGRHRESDSLTRSNALVAEERINELPPWEGEQDSRFWVRESHWAVGWVEWFAIHEDDEAALRAADAMLERIESYPCLDEDHWSQLEWDEACDYWARMSVADRLDAIRASHSTVSPFSARRPEMPSDDNGALLEYLRG